MSLRVQSTLAIVIVVGVFLLPSTVAISPVNSPAWDLQDLPAFPVPLLLAGVFACGLLLSALRLGLGFLANASHPIAQVPLFELDCALIR